MKIAINLTVIFLNVVSAIGSGYNIFRFWNRHSLADSFLQNKNDLSLVVLSGCCICLSIAVILLITSSANGKAKNYDDSLL